MPAPAPRPTVLVVDDERSIADTVVYALRTEGFAPAWCGTLGEARAWLADHTPALLVLDVGLPDGSGFDFCRELRADRAAFPVIFLTARNDVVDRVVGLELGGDDYLTKPFSPRELTARVKAVLRRGAPPASGGAVAAGSAPPEFVNQSLTSAPRPAAAVPGEVVSYSLTTSGERAAGAGAGAAEHPFPPAGPDTVPAPGAAAAGPTWRLDEARCRISFRGRALDLTRMEFRLLKTLLAQPGRVFSRDQLLEAAWDDPGACTDRTVDAHVKLLRGKLRGIAADADPIQTHRGLGYSLREET